MLCLVHKKKKKKKQPATELMWRVVRSLPSRWTHRCIGCPPTAPPLSLFALPYMLHLKYSRGAEWRAAPDNERPWEELPKTEGRGRRGCCVWFITTWLGSIGMQNGGSVVSQSPEMTFSRVLFWSASIKHSVCCQRGGKKPESIHKQQESDHWSTTKIVGD